MEAVPLDYLKTVVFLSVNDGAKTKPCATGFLVNVLVEGTNDLRAHYVVTAKHCIDKARSFGKLYIRVNLKNGSFHEFPTNPDDWICPINSDVALIPFHPQYPKGIRFTDLDCVFYNSTDFVGGAPDYQYVYRDTSSSKTHRLIPRVGHGVYFLGLFTEHYGQGRNLPIARFGNISRMPNDVTLEWSGINLSVIAYLVEFHSLGGHSGSPVFFLYPINIQNTSPLQTIDGKRIDILRSVDTGYVSAFMGIVSAHYPIRGNTETDYENLNGLQKDLNSGIAVVTPSCAVMELLMGEDMKEFRSKLRTKDKSQQATPIMDIAESTNSFTKQDFEDALKRVSRRIKPVEPGKEQS